MSEPRWRPSASRRVLELRARVNARIRAFMARHGILEVETPALLQGTTPAASITPFRVADGQAPRWLQTSPELPMKRLLAAGSGPIYQLCHAWRAGERGRRHNPEFTLLEWYRPGFGLAALMDEVEALLAWVTEGLRPLPPFVRLRWGEAMARHAGLDAPYTAGVEVLQSVLRQAGVEVDAAALGPDLDAWRDLVWVHCVEPALPEAAFVHDFPVSQAALACVRPGDPPVAERFEAYLGGMELANGFFELRDPEEQRRRFAEENRRRAAAGLAPLPEDSLFLEALESGLPACSGVALGVDRLLMWLTGAETIDAVLAFPWERA